MSKAREKKQLNLMKHITRENTIILNNINRKREEKRPSKQDNRRE